MSRSKSARSPLSWGRARREYFLGPFLLLFFPFQDYNGALSPHIFLKEGEEVFFVVYVYDVSFSVHPACTTGGLSLLEGQSSQVAMKKRSFNKKGGN